MFEKSSSKNVEVLYDDDVNENSDEPKINALFTAS